MEECNLRVIPRLTELHGIPVGWSDHTPGLTTALGAVALGAPILEKHFTSDRTLPGPDHLASLEPDALTDYVAATKQLARALGDGVKVRMPSEEENAALVRRSWHAARALPVGTELAGTDLQLLRPEGGISPAVDIRGRVLARAVEAGAPGHRRRPRPLRRPVMTTPLTVAVFVGTRADLGPLSPVLEALQADDDVALTVLTGVMYAADDLVTALPSSASADEWREVVVPLAEPMAEVTVDAQLEQGALLARAAGRAAARAARRRPRRAR